MIVKIEFVIDEDDLFEGFSESEQNEEALKSVRDALEHHSFERDVSYYKMPWATYSEYEDMNKLLMTLGREALEKHSLEVHLKKCTFISTFDDAVAAYFRWLPNGDQPDRAFSDRIDTSWVLRDKTEFLAVVHNDGGVEKRN